MQQIDTGTCGFPLIGSNTCALLATIINKALLIIKLLQIIVLCTRNKSGKGSTRNTCASFLMMSNVLDSLLNDEIFEQTLLQKGVVCTEFDIYVFIRINL
jgi:hypothetical protein